MSGDADWEDVPGSIRSSRPCAALLGLVRLVLPSPRPAGISMSIGSTIQAGSRRGVYRTLSNRRSPNVVFHQTRHAKR